MLDRPNWAQVSQKYKGDSSLVVTRSLHATVMLSRFVWHQSRDQPHDVAGIL